MRSMLQSEYGLVSMGRACILLCFLRETGLICLHIKQGVVYCLDLALVRFGFFLKPITKPIYYHILDGIWSHGHERF